MDFTKTSTDQLKRSLKFHENDIGTMTMQEECRRMYLVQEISAELQRREPAPKAVEYVPMRVSYVVVSRPGPDLKWWEQARFDDPTAASDYCIFLRKHATNPGFECLFMPSVQ